MNIVVDTNIVFSSILSPNGKIHDLLLNSGTSFNFYSPTFLLDELELHHNKLQKISGLSDVELSFLKRTLFQHIEFIDPTLIKDINWQLGYNLVSDVDENDTPFIALALELNGFLWTGDKKLQTGLSKKGIAWILTTDQLQSNRN